MALYTTLELWYSPKVRQYIRERAHFTYGVGTGELTAFKTEEPPAGAFDSLGRARIA